jgi:hypothetical protein
MAFDFIVAYCEVPVSLRAKPRKQCGREVVIAERTLPPSTGTHFLRDFHISARPAVNRRGSCSTLWWLRDPLQRNVFTSGLNYTTHRPLRAALLLYS